MDNDNELDFLEEGNTIRRPPSWDDFVPPPAPMRYNVPDSFFAGFNMSHTKPKKKRKSLVQNYKEFKKYIKDNFKAISPDVKNEFSSKFEQYIFGRDEQILREILTESKELRTIRDMRCFIEEYIMNRR